MIQTSTDSLGLFRPTAKYSTDSDVTWAKVGLGLGLKWIEVIGVMITVKFVVVGTGGVFRSMIVLYIQNDFMFEKKITLLTTLVHSVNDFFHFPIFQSSPYCNQ